MRKQLAAGMAAFSLLSGAVHAAVPNEEVEELETVVVTGEQPGPGLWKVSKGDHTMWVLASYGPLPKDMIWRSKQVEARVAESQEVLYPPSIRIGPDIGLFRGLTLLPAALKAGKIPDNQTLKDVLVPETYEKWRVLREKYIGKDDDVEKWRPALALGQLRGAVFSKNKLYGGPSVETVVDRAAKQHKVRIHRLPVIERKVKVEDPRGMLKSARKLALPDVECFTRGLDHVESDGERVKVLANAWSRGDIDTLRSLHRDPKLKDALKEDCGYVLMAAFNESDSTDAARAKKLLAEFEWQAEWAMVQAQQDWVAAAQVALEKNSSTFAVLPWEDVFRADGRIAKLRGLGYAVEEPR